MFYLLLALQTIRYLLLAPLTLVGQLVGIVFLNWWLPLLARPILDTDWLWTTLAKDPAQQGIMQCLPNWLSWFQTFDATIDAGWRDQYFPNSYTPSNPPPYWTRKYYQWLWLNRNCAYGLAYYPLGCAVQVQDWTATLTETTDHQTFTAVSSTGLWSWRYSGVLGHYNLGWKLANYYDLDNRVWYTVPWGPEWRTQIVMSINPFKRSI